MIAVQDRSAARAATHGWEVVARLCAGACGAAMLVFGVWALGWPTAFAAFVDFPPYNEHLLHDVGAFQIGIGAGLLLALVSGDALLVVLAGFVVAGTLHAVNHGTDLHLGGHASDPWGLGGLVLVAVVGLAARWRSATVRGARGEAGR